ncbi:MAG: ABC transporter permease [Bacteroidota bacterium]
MLRKLSYNFSIGLEALIQNRLRAFLTSLGIIFGVASVIAMLAIGRGAEQEILTKMETLGANNLIIQPIIEQEEGEPDEEEDAENKVQRFTPGLTLQDAYSLGDLPFVKAVSPEIEVESIAIRSGRKRSVKLVGVNNSYFENGTFRLAQGAVFSAEHQEFARPVCVIGSSVRSRFFPTEEPIGKQIKCGKLWLTVIGVMKARNISRDIRDELGIRNYDLDIYIPIETMLLRFKNRALVTQSLIQQANMEDDDDDPEKPKPNYHQLDRMVLQVEDSRYMYSLAEISNRMLSRRHNQVVDFEIIVPELLLKQKQETTDMFNFVLFAIASIALIVGGIGIMNIMLASVLERIKEIGLRLSLGATQRDIILQFMSEAVAISISGGILGILLGISLSAIIGQFTGIETIVSIQSIVLSFFVAVSVGLIFGIYPAQKAAKQDPVISLRSN